jgi:predicted nucleic acid-binding protein
VSNYVILDTDIFSILSTETETAPRYEAVLGNCTQALTFVSVAELLYVARHAGWGTRRTADLSERIKRMALLPYDRDLPSVWARLRDEARRRGHPIAQAVHANDLWIAACAVRYRAPLVTRNLRHFLGIPELTLIKMDDLDASCSRLLRLLAPC